MSTLKVDELLAADGTLTTPPSIPALDTRMCSAWVNFDGQGAVTIRDSYNVSSITDIAVGRYTVNFTNVISNNDYTILASGAGTTFGGDDSPGTPRTPAAAPVRYTTSGGNLNDTLYSHAAIFANP